MTAALISPVPLQHTRLARFIADARQASPLLFANGIAMLVLFAASVAISFVDDRTLLGVNIWHKPAKFFFSLFVHMMTLAWAVSLLDHATTTRRTVRWAAWATVIAAWVEMANIAGRAARGEASHFNTATPIDGALYTLMGLGALTLTISAAVLGVVVWRTSGKSLMRWAAGLGLVLGAVLATLVAGYMSSTTGHAVGGDANATGLPLFHWSTTGGDLRIAHFIGLHAMQLVPLAALSGKRNIVLLAAFCITVATAATFLQALWGIPLLRV